MRRILNGKKLVLGACYYPEHWPKTMWKEDLQRMLGAGIEVIRIAEFAWNKIEPEEGRFTDAFFGEFLDLAEEVGMKVIFCTPSATPPAWLTEAYPEVLNSTKEGVLFRHGARRHYNYSSERYRELVRRVVEYEASHYAKRECIIGWQIDNEVNCEVDVFYSEADTQAFRRFLKTKYGTLEALNEAWGTVFWNQTYTDWGQIYVPRPLAANGPNPHMELDYRRFVSAMARSFVKLQSDVIRRFQKPDDFITTNGLFGNLDNHAMTEESLDFLMYDSYPNFAYCLDDYREDPGSLKDRMWSRNLSEVRSASPVFGIMEQQSGANGWTTRMEAPTPRPGQLTLWTMQSIAHGADFVSYFRWRTCTVGTEIYWHGILDYSGRENRRLREVRSVSEKLRKLQEIAGSRFCAKTAVLRDYDNVWDADLDVWHRRVEEASQTAVFAAAQRLHMPLDYCYLTERTSLEDLLRYDLLIYPHMTIVTEKQAKLLQSYVEAGKTLVIGCRSGYKEESGHCVTEYLPGLLRDLTGADVREYSFLPPDKGPVIIDWDGTKLEAEVFADEAEPVGDARCLARYSSDYFSGSGALICREHKSGRAYYYGSTLNEASAIVFLEKLGAAEPYRKWVRAPKSCEVAVREKDGKSYLFLLNYDRNPAVIHFEVSGVDLLTETEVEKTVSLEGFGSMVVRIAQT